MERSFTGVFVKDGKWWVAYAEELPGANTQGRTLEEARENLKDAVSLLLDVNRELAQKEIGDRKFRREELVVKTA